MPAFLKSRSSHVPSAHTACSQYCCCKLSTIGEEETSWVEDKTAIFRKQVSLDQTVLHHSRKWAFPCVITRQADLPGRPFGFDFLMASALLHLHYMLITLCFTGNIGKGRGLISLSTSWVLLYFWHSGYLETALSPTIVLGSAEQSRFKIHSVWDRYTCLSSVVR